jgi:hypothetical protein
MATKLIEYADASDEVRAVYDDIMVSRKTDYVNHLWKAMCRSVARCVKKKRSPAISF